LGTKTSFNLPQATLVRLRALALQESPDRPNITATLVRLILEAHRAAGLPEPMDESAARTSGGKLTREQEDVILAAAQAQLEQRRRNEEEEDRHAQVPDQGEDADDEDVSPQR